MPSVDTSDTKDDGRCDNNCDDSIKDFDYFMPRR
jgi:hypothetical protein